MAVGEGVDEAVEQLINTASALGSTTIDLSKKRLTQVPPEVLNLQQLEVHFTVLLLRWFLRVVMAFTQSYVNRLIFFNSLLIKGNLVLVTCFSFFSRYFNVFVFLLFSVFVSGGECHFCIAGRVVWLLAKLEMARFTKQPHIRDSSHHWKTQVW